VSDGTTPVVSAFLFFVFSRIDRSQTHTHAQLKRLIYYTHNE